MQKKNAVEELFDRLQSFKTKTSGASITRPAALVSGKKMKQTFLLHIVTKRIIIKKHVH